MTTTALRTLSHLWFISTAHANPMFSIPLKFTSNNEHFVATVSFGSPRSFSLDVILDTGSANFHIYPHSNNNLTTHSISPPDTASFRCICQRMLYSDPNGFLFEDNSTWLQYQNVDNASSITPFLSGCPVFNESTCTLWGEQCWFATVRVHHDDVDEDCAADQVVDDGALSLNATNSTNDGFCRETVCKAIPGNHTLIINDEHAKFECAEHCYSGIDVVSFLGVASEGSGQFVPYVFADRLIVDGRDHNISLFRHESWADGLLGFVYDFERRTSLWQVLGVGEQHSVTMAFDSLAAQLDVGGLSDFYSGDDAAAAVEYSESIWWDVGYHYFYLYALTICGVDLLDAVGLGGHYLAMIDSGAMCLTLPPEIFDVVFKYVPFGWDCNENSTFCYIDPAVDGHQSATFDAEDFAMFSFRMSVDGEALFISLRDLVVALEGDSVGSRYCVERGPNSVAHITECQIVGKNGGHSPCTNSGIIIFGTKALRSLYSVLDFPSKRVGFANNVLSGYSQETYDRANANVCKKRLRECPGEDTLNRRENVCESGRAQCQLYWGWTYDEETHFCVLQDWLCMAIVAIWITIMSLLFVFVKFKLWVERNVFVNGIKV